ncbi:MAG: magnesium/cobalt transporter CorA [Alphaproteobacteria bacterium]
MVGARQAQAVADDGTGPRPETRPETRPARRSRRRRAPPGASPGTLVADPDAVRPVIRVMAYGPGGLEEAEITDLGTLSAYLGRQSVTWIDVCGLGDIDVIRRLGEIFALHHLALEDVINVHQRPKVEEYEKHAFIVTRLVHSGPVIDTDQLSIFLGANHVLTFQERACDALDPVRARIRRDRGVIRGSGADYLAYALIDAAIDAYFPVLEHLGERIEALEQEVIVRPVPPVFAEIQEVKRDMLVLRRAIWSQRDMTNALIRESSPYVLPKTRVFLRDCYDHTVQLIDSLETYRELATGLVEIYMSGIGNRLNEIMKVLAIIATIFIPLSFVAGIYGMNFDTRVSPWNMPELSWAYGYPFALALMAVIALGLVYFFWRRGWIGAGPARRP